MHSAVSPRGEPSDASVGPPCERHIVSLQTCTPTSLTGAQQARQRPSASNADIRRQALQVAGHITALGLSIRAFEAVFLIAISNACRAGVMRLMHPPRGITRPATGLRLRQRGRWASRALRSLHPILPTRTAPFLAFMRLAKYGFTLICRVSLHAPKAPWHRGSTATTAVRDRRSL